MADPVFKQTSEPQFFKNALSHNSTVGREGVAQPCLPSVLRAGTGLGNLADRCRQKAPRLASLGFKSQARPGQA